MTAYSLLLLVINSSSFYLCHIKILPIFLLLQMTCQCRALCLVTISVAKFTLFCLTALLIFFETGKSLKSGYSMHKSDHIILKGWNVASALSLSLTLSLSKKCILIKQKCIGFCNVPAPRLIVVGKLFYILNFFQWWYSSLNRTRVNVRYKYMFVIRKFWSLNWWWWGLFLTRLFEGAINLY